MEASLSMGPTLIPDVWLARREDPAHIARAAISRNDMPMLRGVLESGMLDITRRDRFGRSLLALAVEAGRVDSFTALVEAGGDVSAVDHDRISLLMRAVVQGHIDMVQALLRLNCDIEALDQHGRTAAHLAAARGQTDCLLSLIAAGAAFEPVDRFGATPRTMAFEAGHQQVVELLDSMKFVQDESAILESDIRCSDRNFVPRL